MIVQSVVEFRQKFGLPCPDEPTGIEPTDLLHGLGTLEEEVLEYRTNVELALIAPTVEDNEGMLDALVDIVYFAVGIAIKRGWDFDEAFARVHAANMGKELAGASANKRQSPTDLIKPHGWQSASLRDLVEERNTTVGELTCETNGSAYAGNLHSEQRTYSLLEIVRSSEVSHGSSQG